MQYYKTLRFQVRAQDQASRVRGSEPSSLCMKSHSKDRIHQRLSQGFTLSLATLPPLQHFHNLYTREELFLLLRLYLPQQVR
ncbi:hypothetical protein LDENG_00010370 [Lucifuga dentata]|nr:hypothetical protein LDENG_00010370 [Lucifuga dentata]